MTVHVMIYGFGFSLQILTFDIVNLRHMILSWAIFKKHRVWRSEAHSRTEHGYDYTCYKNGKLVEHLTFRNPVVNHAS